MKKSMAVLFPAGIVLVIAGASAKAAAPLTPYPATAVVTNDASGDGLLNDGHDTYVMGNSESSSSM